MLDSNSPNQRPYTFDRVVRILFTLGLIVGVIYLLDYLSSVLLPFLVAIILAYILNPIIVWVQKKVKKRMLAVLIVLFGLQLVVGGILTLIVPFVIEDIVQMSHLVNTYSQQIEWLEMLPMNEINQFIAQFENFNVKTLLQQKDFRDLIQTTLSMLWTASTEVLGVVGVVVSLVSMLLYLVFILNDYEAVTTGWKKFIPEHYRGLFVGLVNDLNKGMKTYFVAQSKIVLGVTILFVVGFKITGIPLGIILGITVGLMNYVPYLQTVGIIPALLLGIVHSMETGHPIGWVLFSVLMVFVVVQLIQEAILVPRIMGKSTGLNPAIVLLSISIWGSLLGMLGMVIALPVTTLMVSYYKRFILKKNTKEDSGDVSEGTPA